MNTLRKHWYDIRGILSIFVLVFVSLNFRTLSQTELLLLMAKEKNAATSEIENSIRKDRLIKHHNANKTISAIEEDLSDGDDMSRYFERACK